MELQLLLLGSLDQLQQQLSTVAEALLKGEVRSPDPYLGVLSPALYGLEDCNVYGYVAASQVKVLALVRDGACRHKRDEEAILRSLLRQLLLGSADHDVDLLGSYLLR